MASAAQPAKRFDDLECGQRVGRFNRLKEHVPFETFRRRGKQRQGGVIYFARQDAESLEVDLAGAKVVLARGPCLPPREELDDYQSMPPLAPILLANVLRAHGAEVELRDLLMSRARPAGVDPARDDEPIGREEWSRALHGHASERVAALVRELMRELRPGGADAIGLSMETTGDFLLALVLSREIRRLFSIPTLIGGRGVLLPEPLMLECPDAYVVHDEGEIPLLLCLDALLNDRPLGDVPSLAFVERGEIRSTQAMIHDLDVRPTYDLSGAGLEGYRGQIEIEGSGPIVPYQYGIGCPCRCGFCNATSRRVVRLRSPEKIVADLANVTRRFPVERFHMLSHLLNADARHLDELLARLEAAKLELYWSDCCRPVGLRAETLQRMRRVGASVLVWGVDCGSARLSRIMKKGVSHDQALHILKASHRAGIRNIVNIIMGMPHETEQDIEETLRFIDRTKPYVHKFETPIYLFHHASLLARNPDRYGLRPGVDGGVDEPGGLSWQARQAGMAALARRMARSDPLVRGYDVRGHVARRLTGPTLRTLWNRLRG